MDWFLYDRDLRLVSVKQIYYYLLKILIFTSPRIMYQRMPRSRFEKVFFRENIELDFVRGVQLLRPFTP